LKIPQEISGEERVAPVVPPQFHRLPAEDSGDISGAVVALRIPVVVLVGSAEYFLLFDPFLDETPSPPPVLLDEFHRQGERRFGQLIFLVGWGGGATFRRDAQARSY